MTLGLRRQVVQVLGSGDPGGGTNHVLHLLQALPERGWSVRLLVDPRGPLLHQVQAMGIPAHPVRFFDSRLDLRVASALARLLRQHSPALVHAHGTRAAWYTALAYLLRPSLRRIPSIYTEHGLSTDVSRSPLSRRLAWACERLAMGSPRRLIAVSDYGAEQIAQILPSGRTRIRKIPYGIPATQRFLQPATPDERRAARATLGLDPSRPVMAFVGRLVPQKQPILFLAAAAQVRCRITDLQVVMLGDGPLHPQCLETAQASGLSVHMAGWQPDSIHYLTAADVLVITSAWEGLPLTVLEAMAIGTPVVSTPAGGIRDVLDHRQTGLCASTFDASEVAQLTIEILSDNDLANRCRLAAFQLVHRKHSVAGMLGAIEAMYIEVLREAAT